MYLLRGNQEHSYPNASTAKESHTGFILISYALLRNETTSNSLHEKDYYPAPDH